MQAVFWNLSAQLITFRFYCNQSSYDWLWQWNTCGVKWSTNQSTPSLCWNVVFCVKCCVQNIVLPLSSNIVLTSVLKVRNWKSFSIMHFWHWYYGGLKVRCQKLSSQFLPSRFCYNQPSYNLLWQYDTCDIKRIANQNTPTILLKYYCVLKIYLWLEN